MTLRLIVISSILLVACKSDPPKPGDTPTNAASTAAPTAPAAPPAPAAPTPPPPAPADAFAGGFCEYAVDGGAPNKGGGGMMNVQAAGWMTEQQGKKLAMGLLVNCGTGKQVNIMSSEKVLPLAPGKFKIVKGAETNSFAVLGPDFMGGEGELELTAFDDVHVAGSFSFKAAGKTYAGTFDIKCPFPGNGLCK